MTHTGTWLSNRIKHATGDMYNHVSVSLTKDLSEMYSFGRRSAYNPFVGGFVQEHPQRGTFKRFKNTVCKILELKVTDESYRIIKDIIKYFYEERNRFKFNFIGILKARKNINYQKSYRKFYCSQFVRYLLVCAHVIPGDFFGPVVTPQEYSQLPNAKPIYEGLLREYPIESEDASKKNCLLQNEPI